LKITSPQTGADGGGALAMKTYGHLRNEHSQAMAQKVTSFGRVFRLVRSAQ
jgi:hypothetical protein